MTHIQKPEGQRRGAKRWLARTAIAQARQPHRLVVERLEDRRLLAPLAPTVTTLAATNVNGTAATLNGSVDPEGAGTDTLFQFSTDPTLPANVVTTLAGSQGHGGSADGTGSAARFNLPEGVAVDAAGDVYVSDAIDDTIRKITPAGVVTTLAGSPGQSGSADGTGSAARFSVPWGLAVDSAGNIYVADSGNDTIREITPAGVVTTLAGAPGQPGSADGTGSAARFNMPKGIAVDSAGNVYVADTDNSTIREITPAGLVTTLAGTAGQSGSADGIGSAARFNGPSAVAVDSAGNVYVADTANDTIRKITPAGLVTTLAGAPGEFGSADGTGSAARFRSPTGLAVDGEGNVYVSDFGNGTIREITPAGVVTTLAGAPVPSVGVDGTGSAARFNFPTGLALDAAGDIYVADSGDVTIRKLSIPSVPAQSGLIGTSALAVNAVLTGLTPGTTYSFRVVATNLGGTSLGNTLSVVTPFDGPHVTSMQRFGFHAQPTTLVIQFNEALDPTRAQDVANYRIVGLEGVPVAITRAVYDAATETVTLFPKTRLDLHKIYRLTIKGTGAEGVADVSGNLLDGANNGRAGSDYVTSVTAADLVLTDPPGGPLRLKRLRREAGEIAARELAFLNRVSAKAARVENDKRRPLIRNVEATGTEGRKQPTIQQW